MIDIASTFTIKNAKATEKKEFEPAESELVKLVVEDKKEELKEI